MDIRFLMEQTAGLTVIYALAATTAWALRTHSAASRHMVWWVAAVAALVLPAASLLKPAGSPGVLVAPAQTTLVMRAAASAQTVPEGWGTAEVLTAIWMTGFFFLAARLAGGLIRSIRRFRSAESSAIHVDRPGVEVRLSSQITVPETFGALRPVILLPEGAAAWTPERLHVVLAHELVHIQRRDWTTQLIGQFSACLYWFHPLAWYALAQMRRERELACDDGVLRLGYKNSDYAQHLIDVARGVRSHTEALAPSVPMATQSQLETRVKAILNPTRNRANVPALMKAALAAGAVIAIAFFSSANRAAAAGIRISGVVKDASAGVVPKASIMLTSIGAEKSRTLATVTGGDGEWEVSAEPGKYALEIRQPGFRALHQEITIGYTPARFESTLELGTLQETIRVQGETTVPPRQTNSTPTRVRVGGAVQAAKLIRQDRPVYPEHLKNTGITGTVVLRAVIGREGGIVNFKVISPEEVHPDLVAAAVDAVRQWKYEPTRLNGEPVEVLTMITIDFTLTRE